MTCSRATYVFTALAFAACSGSSVSGTSSGTGFSQSAAAGTNGVGASGTTGVASTGASTASASTHGATSGTTSGSAASTGHSATSGHATTSASGATTGSQATGSTTGTSGTIPLGDTCTSCTQDSECTSSNAYCALDLETAGKGYCAIDCSQGGTCASGYSCSFASDYGDTTESLQVCYPTSHTCAGAGTPDGGCITEFQACSTASDCECNEACVADPAFSQSDSPTVCETVCTTNADCPNAASICGGSLASGSSTCEVNLCDSNGITNQEEGSVCDATAAGSQDGTCVRQACADALLCLPNGTATSCNPYTDDDPYYSLGPAGGSEPASLLILTPQPRDAGALCPAGKACQPNAAATSGKCATLCQAGDSTPCAHGDVCVAAWSDCENWGFCGACVVDGGSCILDTDCCANLCNTNQQCGCQAKSATCNLATDCCNGNCTDNVCG